MSIRVLADDDSVHVFPNGTGSDVITGVLARYHAALASASQGPLQHTNESQVAQAPPSVPALRPTPVAISNSTPPRVPQPASQVPAAAPPSLAERLGDYSEPSNGNSGSASSSNPWDLISRAQRWEHASWPYVRAASAAVSPSVFSAAAIPPSTFYQEILPAMLYGSDAHAALATALSKRDGPGTWVYNRTYGGMFGRKRPDYLYAKRYPVDAFELKKLGEDDAAKRQLAAYLEIGGPDFVAGDPQLVFRGNGSLTAESEGLLGGNEYDYFPGKYRGALGYTMHDREGKLQELGETLWKGVIQGLSNPPMTMPLNDPEGSPNNKPVVPPYWWRGLLE